MRIRTIKPEFWSSESVGRLSRDARLLFIGLWNLADDAGRCRACPRMLASVLFPYDEDSRGFVEASLIELDVVGMIRRYTIEGYSYLDIPNWLKHQKIDRPSPSKLPPFDEGSRVIVEDSSRARCRNGREGRVNEAFNFEALKRNTQEGEKSPESSRLKAIDEREEQEIMEVCTELLGKDTMVTYGGSWRKRAREEPAKLWRVLAEVRSAQKEGRGVRHAGAFANDLWERFK